MKANETERMESNPESAEANKHGLADHYGVGIRTVENWLAWGIIVGRKQGRELIMNVADCNARLMRHKK